MTSHRTEFPFTATLIERAKTPKDMDRWIVNIDGYEIPYRKGIGHREGHKWPYHGRHTIHDMEAFNDPLRSCTVDPTLREVLECVASDASCYESSRDLDDFAAEFGFDGGKISETIKAYEACKEALLFFAKRGLDYTAYLEDGAAWKGAS